MRTDEERLSAMHERAQDLENKKNARITKGIAAVAIAASIVLIVLAAVNIQGTIGYSQGLAHEEGMSASIFASNSAIGFVVIGILAFLLGISVTILCYRLKRNGKK